MKKALNISFLFYCLFHQVFAECNGGSSLCDKSYSDITQLITHDSYALSPNIAATQDYSILDQLNDGVRGIKLSAIPSTKDPAMIHVCHSICAVLDAGPVEDTLNSISQWLIDNPKEVVTIMWNNFKNFKADQFASVYEASEIMPFVYTHDGTKPWPTLRKMIESGKRVVNFIDAEADSENVPWLMDQFNHVFETPYDNTDANAFNCIVDRIGQDSDPKELMYVMNHFLYGVIEISSFKIEIPVREKANLTNTHASLANHINQCTNAFGKKPNFIEVDFYHIGDALDVVASMNGVTPSPITPKNKIILADDIQMALNMTESLSLVEHVYIDNTSFALPSRTWPKAFCALFLIVCALNYL